MYLCPTYILAVVFCVVTMFCWGSWANTQKLVNKKWRYELFYWDYVLGVLLTSLVFAYTMGSHGEVGRDFVTDLGQASPSALGWAFAGGVVFNIANILLVSAIDIAGMTGALLMAAVRRIPVILDGLITLSAALAATLLCPKVREILIPSHFPREPMGRRILEELKLHAVIDGNLALGEGTGAILLIPMLDVCLEYYNNGTCFDGLGIEAYQRFEEEMP